ncbi:hypothetical protein KAR91_25315 [Candidatus Pacearchaeota archaeon]|nr:hypothetical protein [Candidatus Pacearchaeota archaeon]
MNTKEFKKAVRECSHVYGFVMIDGSEGYYVRLVKSDVLRNLLNNSGAGYNAKLGEDGCLYL